MPVRVKLAFVSLGYWMGIKTSGEMTLRVLQTDFSNAEI